MWVSRKRCVLRWGGLAALGLMFAALAPTGAQARVVGPGEGTDSEVDPFTGVSLADRPDLIGQVIADLTVPFDNGLVLQGTIRTQVVREDVSGTLDFYYQLSRGIDGYSISGFDNFFTDVDFRTDLGRGAAGVGRSADGDKLTFSFVANDGPTFVKTNATEFALTGSFLIFDDNSDPIPATATVFAPVPLPPAVLAAPAALALAGLAGRMLKRRA
jgi:hypothetical protein